MKKLFYSSAVLFGILFIFSCKKAAPVSIVPVISFASFTASSDATGMLTFNFSDGDGDIGVPSGDSTIDCYIRYYYKSPTTGNYLTCYAAITGNAINSLADSNIYTYSIPYVNDNLKTKSLDGQIVINMNGYKPDLGGGNAGPNGSIGSDSLNYFRYTIWIFDRAGHKSNVVTTPGLYTKFAGS